MTLDHPFEPWTYSNGVTICIHWDGLRLCERPQAEHASAQVGGDPVQEGEGVGADGGQVQ